MQPAIDALTNIGISIHDSNGELKTATTILDEVAIAFKNVNEETKQNTAVTLAGRYQLSRFLALVENRNIAHSAAEAALNSEGSAMRENAAYMESYEARINLMKTAWQEFSLSMGNAVIGDSIISLTHLLTGLANHFTDVVDTVGLLPPVLGSTALAVALVSKNFRVATISAITFGKGLKAVGVSANTAKVAIRSLAAATVVGAVFVALGFALEGLIKLFSKSTEEQETFFNELKSNISDTNSQINQLNQLNATLNDQKATQEELDSTYKTLSGSISNIVSHYDSEGNAVYKTREEVLELVKAEQELLNIKLKSQQLELFNGFKEEIKTLENAKDQVKKLSEEMNSSLASENAYRIIQSVGDSSALFGWDANYSENLEKLKSQVREAFEEAGVSGSEAETYILNNLRQIYNSISENGLEATLNTIKGYGTQTEAALEKQKAIILGKSNEFNDLLKGFGRIEASESQDKNLSVVFNSLADSVTESTDVTKENFDALVYTFRDNIAKISGLVNTGEIDLSKMINTGDFTELYALIPELEGKLSEFSLKSQSFLSGMAGGFQIIDEAGVPLGTFGSKAEAAAQGIRILEDSLVDTEDGTVVFTGVVESSAESLENYTKQVDSLLSELSSLNNMIDQVSKGESLNAEEVSKLIRAYPELESRIIQTANGYSIEKQALELVRDSKLDLLQKTQLAEAGISTAVYTQLQLRLANYDIELNAIQTLADARSAMYQMMGNEFGLTDEEAKMVDSIHKIARLRETFNNLYANPTKPYGVNPSKSKSSSKSDSSKLKDETDARINAIMTEATAQGKLTDSLEKSIDKYSELTEQIAQNTDVYKSQNEEIYLTNQANKRLQSELDKLQSQNKKYDLSSWIDANGEATQSFIKLYNSMKSGSSQESLDKLFNQYRAYAVQIKENVNVVNELTLAQKALRHEIDQLKLDNTKNYLDSLSGYVEDYADAITKSKKVQDLYTEGSNEYNKILLEQGELLKNQESRILANIEAAKKEMRQGSLTIDQIKELTSFIEAQELALLDVLKAQKDYSDSWQSSIKKSTEEAIDVLEKYYDTQRDLEEKSLDDSLKAYEDYINARKRLLSRQDSEDDFQKERTKLQEEELSIRQKIDLLSLDSSFEAQSKREDLEIELQKKLEEISELELQRTRKLRDENLDDLLDSKKKEIETQKKALDDKWQVELQTDQNYYSLKQSLLRNNISDMESALKTFADNTASYYDKIFYAIDLALENKLGLLNQFDTVKGNISDSLASKPANPNASRNNGATTWEDYNKNSQSAMASQQSAWNEYLSNKQTAEAIKLTNPALFEQLRKRNNELRGQYNFIDGSFADLSKLKNIAYAAQGGLTPTWGQSGKLGVLHQNELVLNAIETKDILKVHEMTQSLLSGMQNPVNGNQNNNSQSDNYYYTVTLTGTSTRKDKEDMIDILEKRKRKGRK